VCKALVLSGLKAALYDIALIREDARIWLADFSAPCFTTAAIRYPGPAIDHAPRQIIGATCLGYDVDREQWRRCTTRNEIRRLIVCLLYSTNVSVIFPIWIS
jgi:hypothetical protein